MDNLENDYEEKDTNVSRFVNCVNRDADVIKNIYKGESKQNKLALLHLNIRSLKNKENFESIINFLTVLQVEFDIIAVTETWFMSLEEANFFSIDNYVAEHFIRGSRGGGVTLFIHNSCEYVRKNIDIVNAESVFVEIRRSDVRGKILVGGIYKPPNMNNDNIQEFTNSIHLLLNQYVSKKCILLGDLNIDLTKQEGMDFSNELSSMGLISCIDIPTRVTPLSSSVIDHIFTNIMDQFIESGTIDVDISDHKATFVIFENLMIKFKHINDGDYFNFKNYNYDDFEKNLKKTDWNKISRMTDPNAAYSEFCQIFYNLSKCFICAKKKIKEN